MLTVKFIENLRTEGQFSDGLGGQGLALRSKVLRRGGLSKRWLQRMTLKWTGERIYIPLGSYPVVSLADARAKALENAMLVATGVDPRRGIRNCPTFGEMTYKAVEIYSETWRNSEGRKKAWLRQMEMYALGVLGDIPVDEITTADVIDVLLPIWTVKHPTAKEVMRSIRRVLDSCVQWGELESNPVTNRILLGLPNVRRKDEHNRYIHHRELGDAMRKIRGSTSAYRLALEFTILTATRVGEMSKARWKDIDMEERIWTIPSHVAKNRNEFRVPLSDEAMNILEMRAIFGTEPDQLVFTGLKGGRITKNSPLDLLVRLGIDAATHGFRATFRTWCAEMGVPDDLAEVALAHTPTKLKASYQHSDLLTRRRPLMDAWGAFVDGRLGDDWRWSEV